MGLVFFALAVMTMHTELSLLVKEDTLVDLSEIKIALNLPWIVIENVSIRKEILT